ncbi:MAG: ABC transporter ATP-binding protein [Actinomycetota bacterium]|nr:ABC transporter ATP-binding protein [Actinomycetota bacterium]
MIEVRNLTKRYGAAVAVDDLSFDVPAGMVTGFLGPNGAGKSTTMRVILGLDEPTSGTATVLGSRYRDRRQPLHDVGALLEARGIHPGRSARNHLLAMAQADEIPRSRVNEVIRLVGLETVANKRAGGFSLGMNQRLGIATALLGDPQVLLLDEPVNGLDPEGIIWIRTLLRGLAAEGRTVLLSSHLMTEMALTADRLVVIGKGRLIAETTVDAFIRRSSGNRVRVRSPRTADLVQTLTGHAEDIEVRPDNAVIVAGLDCAAVATLASDACIAVHELVAETASLEDAYLELTQDSVEYRPDGADLTLLRTA